MAEEGTTGGTGGTGTEGTGGGAASWTSALPEAIRGHEALKDISDVPTLATRYLETRKPFAEQLPEKIRGEAMFKDIKGLEDLALGFHGQSKLLGVPKDQLLRLPTGDKPEDWAPVYDRLGRPATPEDYKITAPDGQKIDSEIVKSASATAHELGMSQKQLDGWYAWLRETGAAEAGKVKASSDAALAASEAALKTEWGAAYDQKIKDGVSVVDFLERSYPGLKENLDATKLGNSPALARFMADYATLLREDGKMTGRAGGGGNLQSPVEAQQNIAALQGDKNFMKAYTDRRDPGHTQAIERMRALYELAHPETGRAA